MANIYRAEVVGSLQRPGYLTDALKQQKAGTMSAAAFKRIEDRAVDEAIALQEEVGVDVLTDGEQRRFHFCDLLTRDVEGLSPI